MASAVFLRAAATAAAFVRFERLYDLDRPKYHVRYAEGYGARMYQRLVTLLHGSHLAARDMVDTARMWHRQVVRLECGHSLVKYATNRQITSTDTPWDGSLLYPAGFYRAGVSVFCERCEGRPARLCTGVTIDGREMAWTVLTLACSHRKTVEHVASMSAPHHCGVTDCPSCGDTPNVVTEHPLVVAA